VKGNVSFSLLLKNAIVRISDVNEHITRQCGDVGMLGCGDLVVAVMKHSDLRDVDVVIVNGKVRKEGGKKAMYCSVKVGEELCSGRRWRSR
jgi:hypothetical protein